MNLDCDPRQTDGRNRTRQYFYSMHNLWQGFSKFKFKDNLTKHTCTQVSYTSYFSFIFIRAYCKQTIITGQIQLQRCSSSHWLERERPDERLSGLMRFPAEGCLVRKPSQDNKDLVGGGWVLGGWVGGGGRDQRNPNITFNGGV